MATQPPFAEVDAGPQPPAFVPDASVPDAGSPGDAGVDGDAAPPSDAGVDGDAASDGGDAG